MLATNLTRPQRNAMQNFGREAPATVLMVSGNRALATVVGVSFSAGLITGWLLNTYARKRLKKLAEYMRDSLN